VAQPVSINVQTFGTGKIDEQKISDILMEHFDCRPANIIKLLDLKKPIYSKTVAYGHFGREDQGFKWELKDQADALRKKAGL
jgi:S-adenosylmethionine synthetase